MKNIVRLIGVSLLFILAATLYLCASPIAFVMVLVEVAKAMSEDFMNFMDKQITKYEKL